jgi:hypothetical protein
MTPMQQFLVATDTGAEVPISWASTSTPAWQRLAP